jgi:hypothetical protein
MGHFEVSVIWNVRGKFFYLYKLTSKNPITMEQIENYFKEHEGYDSTTESLHVLDPDEDIEFVDLDVLKKS